MSSLESGCTATSEATATAAPGLDLGLSLEDALDRGEREVGVVLGDDREAVEVQKQLAALLRTPLEIERS